MYVSMSVKRSPPQNKYVSETKSPTEQQSPFMVYSWMQINHYHITYKTWTKIRLQIKKDEVNIRCQNVWKISIFTRFFFFCWQFEKVLFFLFWPIPTHPLFLFACTRIHAPLSKNTLFYAFSSSRMGTKVKLGFRGYRNSREMMFGWNWAFRYQFYNKRRERR